MANAVNFSTALILMSRSLIPDFNEEIESVNKFIYILRNLSLLFNSFYLIHSIIPEEIYNCQQLGRRNIGNYILFINEEA